MAYSDTLQHAQGEGVALTVYGLTHLVWGLKSLKGIDRLLLFSNERNTIVLK